MKAIKNLTILMMFFVFLSEYPASASFCDSYEPPSGPTVTVNSESDLRFLSQNTATGTTLLLEPGIYSMNDLLVISVPDITIRSLSGDPTDTVLDFGGMISGHFGILITADDIKLIDLTIQNAVDHGVSVQGVDRPILYNLVIRDIGDQLVKVNPAGDGSDDGLLACCTIEYTTSAPDSYTNGISAHQAHNWTIRDNQWINIRGPGNGYTGPAVLFWSESTDTLVERNRFINCYRGVGFGNAGASPGAHVGGIVRNNIFFATAEHDVAVEMVYATGWLVAHNTVYMTNPTSGLSWLMEARFSGTTGTFINNLLNMSIWEDRDGASGQEIDCLSNGQDSWFVDATNGDLHLVETATQAIDTGEPLVECPEDIDGDSRFTGGAADIGADEWTACINDGDVNQDFNITAADAQLTFLIALGSITATPEETCAADCNGDDFVTAGDAQQIFFVVLGSGSCIN